MKSAVLFLIFNRPDTTSVAFERIREVQPPKLYIAADGPRANKEDDAEKCARTRDIFRNIDWECEVKTLFRDTNLGCGKGVSSAITWFFENEEEGIIIEDDIIPHPDFFKYCDEMLERYRHDARIQLIAGRNAFYEGYDSEYSYYMSSLFHIWGWASWRRVWETYEFDTEKLSLKEFMMKLKKRGLSHSTLKFWNKIFKMMQAGKCDTWDYQLYFNQILNDRCTIIPFINMTENIGFNSMDATHTAERNTKEMQHRALSPYPLNHLSNFSTNLKADKLFAKNFGFNLRPMYQLFFRLCRRIIHKMDTLRE